MAGVNCKLISFTKPISGTPPVTQESAALGFTPKGAIAFYNYTTSTSYAEGFGGGYGFSDGTSHGSTGFAADDNAGSSNAGVAWANTFVCMSSSSSGTTTDKATVSFGSDTITLSWTPISATASTIFVLVLGGDDITNVKVGTFAQSSALGSSTTTGTSFTPDCELYIGTDSTVAAGAALQDAWFNIGAAVSSSKRWVISGDSETGRAAADTWRGQSSSLVFMSLGITSGSVAALADFTAFTTTGRTLNWTDAASTSSKLVYFMAIKGAQVDVGTFTVSAGTGNFDAVTSTSFKPAAVMFYSTGGSTSVTVSEANNRFSVGCGISSTERSCVSAHDTDAATDMINTKVQKTDRCFLLHTANATASSSVTEVELDLVSMNSNGFTINKVTNSTVLGNEFVHWWAIGPPVSAGNAVEKAISESAISVSDSRTVSRNKIRTRTETVTASD